MLTHRTIQYKLAEYMESNGWKREHSNHALALGGISDEVFVSEDKQELHAEVKPEKIGISEIWNGVGETIRILAEPNRKLKSILVCPARHAELAKKVLLVVNSDMIGLLVYNQDCEFIPVINIWGTRDNSWITEDESSKSKMHRDELGISFVNEENITYGKTKLECLKCKYEWTAQRRRIPGIRRCCSNCGTDRIQIKVSGLVK